MSLDEAIHELRASEALVQERPLVGQLALAEGDRLVADESSYRFSPKGFDRFCDELSAPAWYLKELDSDIRHLVLQRHLARGVPQAGRLTLIVRGDEFVAFGRSDLVRVSVSEVFEAIQAAADRELHVHQLQFCGESVRAELLADRVAREVAPGDVLRAGLQVTHSLIGEHATWIEAFVLRLKCLNGLTHRECVKRGAARTRRLPPSYLMSGCSSKRPEMSFGWTKPA